LHDEGFLAGRHFMARHGEDIGVRETLDVTHEFHETKKPRIPLSHSFAPRERIANAIARHAQRETALEHAGDGIPL